MTRASARVFYVRYVPDPIFVDLLRARPGIHLDKLENDTAAPVAAPILAAAHAYQAGASRDELPARFHVDADLLARAPHLLIASSNGAGFDPIDVAACTHAGVIVLNQSGGNARSVAEHVAGMLLVLSKRIPESDHALRAGSGLSRNALMGHEVFGKTIGIIGLGETGRQVAQICSAGLGLKVLAFDPFLDAATMAQRGAVKAGLDDLLRTSDFVSVNCPLNDQTRGMIGAREFGLMRTTAIFITTARGFIHDEIALAAALADKRIAGAGLDVWTKEPPPADHPLLQFDTVIASPHTAGVTHEARRNMGRIAAEQLLATFDGRCPPRLINPEAWPKYSTRFERAFGFKPDQLAG